MAEINNIQSRYPFDDFPEKDFLRLQAACFNDDNTGFYGAIKAGVFSIEFNEFATNISQDDIDEAVTVFVYKLGEHDDYGRTEAGIPYSLYEEFVIPKSVMKDITYEGFKTHVCEFLEDTIGHELTDVTRPPADWKWTPEQFASYLDATAPKTESEKQAEIDSRISNAEEVLSRFKIAGENMVDACNKTIDFLLNGDDNYAYFRARDIKTLILARDAVMHGNEALDFIRPSLKEIQWGMGNGWDKDGVLSGYAVFSDGVNGACVIDRIDDMDTFDGWEEAEKMAEIDGHKFLPLKELKIPCSAVSDDFYSSRGGVGIDGKIHRYRYLDTPENRELLKEYLVPVRNRKAKEPDICR